MKNLYYSMVKKFSGVSGLLPCSANLLKSHTTRVAHVEFTSRCNIRCVYCTCSQPEYKGVDMDMDTLEQVTASLKKRATRMVCVSGGGETTIYQDWSRFCNILLDGGMSLTITSNFAREFSAEEIHTLSRFDTIAVSCDTCDPELFKKLRRGNNLQTLRTNISRIKAMAVEKKLPVPNFSFNCVISDQNIFHLPDLVAFGKSQGVTLFNFLNLAKYPDLKSAVNPQHITELPPGLLRKARESLSETFRLLGDSGMRYDIHQGLLDSLDHKIRAVDTPAPLSPPSRVCHGPYRYTSPQREGQTRDCLDPWEFIMINANAEVRPCCGHGPLANLGKRQSLLEVFNNIPMQMLRRCLLTGDLPPDCLDCAIKGWISTPLFQKKVREFLYPSWRFFKVWPRPDFHKLPAIKKIEPTYETGWYNAETDLTVKDPGCRHWRWTSKQARFTLVNPGRDLRLILRGVWPMANSCDQSIRLELNSSLLDEFCFRNPDFYIEYVIPAKRMGENKTITFEIFNAETFRPSDLEPQTVDSRELGVRVYDLFFTSST